MTTQPSARRPIPEQLLAGLNPEQHQAVSTLDGPLLVVAGPGSGKTRVLTHRIAALVATGTSPGGILAVTFTNKAAAEMRERVANLVGKEQVARMWVATFHSACVRILRDNHAAVGLPRSFSIADAADAVKIVSGCIEAAGELTELNPADRKAQVKACYRRISTAKNNDVDPATLAASPNPDVALAGRIMYAYNKALAARGAVDFDDILLLVLHLLRAHPAVAEHYAARFTHVLVDEFQDTNTVQWEITRLLGGRGNVCVVGDADQSIYAFRGANPAVLDAFTRTFPDAITVRLGRNYRSTKHIVAAAQAVIDKNVSAHRARMSTDNPAGEPVQVVALATDFDEARWVADQIARRGGQLSDHAVLVRTNAQTRVLETILRERAIAHDVVGTVRFFDRAEVKDALSYLRLAVNPVDVIALERAVSAPRRGIGPASLGYVTGAVLTGHAPTISLALEDGAGRGGRAGTVLGRFATILEQVTAAVAGGGPAAGLEVVLGPGGLLEHHTPKETGPGADTGEGRVDNLRELVRSAKDFAEGKVGDDAQGRDVTTLDGLAQTEAFLEYAALMSAAEKPDPAAGPAGPREAVQVATMHAAKGKEWKHVYVVGVEEGICPHSRSETEQELAEERRLLFVATSRAQKSLALTHVAMRRTFKDDVESFPSRFLDDLPADVVRSSAGQARTERWGSGPASLGTALNGWRASNGYYAPRAGRPEPRRAAASSTVAPAPAARHAPGKPGAAPRAVLAPEQVEPGTRVLHPVFGTGTVVELKGTVVTIRFANAVKALSLAHAPLTLETC